MRVLTITRDILGGAVGENFGHGKRCVEVCLAGLWYRAGPEPTLMTLFSQR
jgi:hypothetical protein